MWINLRVAVVGLALLTASATHADVSPSHELARKHYETGKTYYEVANYREALEEFSKAYRLQPLHPLLYNIARCHENLGNLKQAIDAYRQYVQKLPEAQDRGVVEMKIKNLEKRLAGQTPPAPTSVTTEVRPPPARSEPPVDSPPEGRRWKQTTGWVGVGVGGAALITGIAFGVLVKSKNDAYAKGAAAGPEQKTYGELRAIEQDGRRYQKIELGTIITGGVLAAAGAGLLIWDALGSRRPPRAATVTPLVGPGQVGLVGVGRF